MCRASNDVSHLIGRVQSKRVRRLQRRAAAGGPSGFWLGIRSLWSTLLSSTHIGNSALMCQEQVVTIGPVFHRPGGAFGRKGFRSRTGIAPEQPARGSEWREHALEIESQK